MTHIKFYKRRNNAIGLCLMGLLSTALLMTTGCTKWDKLTSPDEGNIYMAQAYSDRSELQVFKIDSPQVFTFGASMAGFKGSPGNTVVEFEVDYSLLSKFNEDHAYLNYDFVPFPKGAYSISSLETTIEKGKSDSKPLTFSIMANKINPSVDYCLPIRIKSVSQGTIDTTLSVAYFMLDSLYIRFHDYTGLAKLSVSHENRGGIGASESSIHVTDDDYTTKYLFFDFDANLKDWIQLKFDSAYKMSAYTLTSGNDSPQRDPKDWEIQGSNDGTQWITLDERTNFSFTSRRETVTFEFNHPDGKSYSYYRMVILDNNGGGLFQMTEWRILQYY